MSLKKSDYYIGTWNASAMKYNGTGTRSMLSRLDDGAAYYLRKYLLKSEYKSEQKSKPMTGLQTKLSGPYLPYVVAGGVVEAQKRGVLHVHFVFES